MRNLVGRLNHRDAVMKHLDALLLFYPPKRQFATDFPALKETIRADFASGVAPPVSALGIALRILESFCGQLGGEEKAKSLAALIETGRAGFAERAKRRVESGKRRPDARGVEPATFVMELCGGALFLAARMREEGTLRQDDLESFAASIATALGDGDAPLARAFAST